MPLTLTFPVCEIGGDEFDGLIQWNFSISKAMLCRTQSNALLRFNQERATDYLLSNALSVLLTTSMTIFITTIIFILYTYVSKEVSTSKARSLNYDTSQPNHTSLEGLDNKPDSFQLTNEQLFTRQ